MWWWESNGRIIILVEDYSKDLIVISLVFLDVFVAFLNIVDWLKMFIFFFKLDESNDDWYENKGQCD